MTEPDFPTNEEAIEIKKHIENLFPKTADFLLYAKPFLTHLAVREKYEDYLLVLKKIGINGIEEMASRFTEFSSIVAENSIEPFKGIFEMLQKKDNYLQSIGANWEEQRSGIMEEITFDSLTPLMSETHDAIYDKYLNNWSSLDEKIADLPQEEEILVNYFEVLMAKLWFKYLIVNPAIPEHLFSVFMKDFLLRYFKSMETLYSEETVPKELISYIETIHIPNEEKLRAKIVGTTHTIIETVNTIPIKNISAIDEQIKFETLFESSQHYYFIMNLLVEKGFCQAETYLWKDENNGTKGFLVAILKYLYIQGYYKNNKRLTNDQIEKIVKNTFGLQISEDTIKKTKAKNFDLKFIQPATKIT